jgi:hypothetical protein
MTTRLILAALAATASFAVAACGGDRSPSGAKSGAAGARGIDAKSKMAMLNFARCMRQHGVDMPDPQFDSGGGARMTQRESDPEKARAAEKACKHFQDEVKPPPMSQEQQAQARKAALANSRCMREHGINMPDPQFGEGGRMTMRIDKSSGIDPNDPKFREAQKACQKAGGGMGSIMGGKAQ